MNTLSFTRSNRLSLGLVLAAGLILAANARAQSKAPGPQDYPAFGQFIASRNIFDPNRQPHYTASRPSVRRTHVNTPPDLQLVGTMSYEKGWFAFFNGNGSDLRQVLPVKGGIAGHTVMEIRPGQVTLEPTNQSAALVLKVGQGLRQEGGKWVLSEGGSGPANNPGTERETTDNSERSGSRATPSTSEPNEVLKRLMQLREKENQ